MDVISMVTVSQDSDIRIACQLSAVCYPDLGPVTPDQSTACTTNCETQPADTLHSNEKNDSKSSEEIHTSREAIEAMISGRESEKDGQSQGNSTSAENIDEGKSSDIGEGFNETHVFTINSKLNSMNEGRNTSMGSKADHNVTLAQEEDLGSGMGIEVKGRDEGLGSGYESKADHNVTLAQEEDLGSGMGEEFKVRDEGLSSGEGAKADHNVTSADLKGLGSAMEHKKNTKPTLPLSIMNAIALRSRGY
ncbi:uncharacterized protein [Hyperolius riggenbachi]|uniref:uncharacterized protein isoform X2 n=1 Tax=Hyperolius riggenbachi TaxID=752182 RepID=UPI0035A2EBD3